MSFHKRIGRANGKFFFSVVVQRQFLSVNSIDFVDFSMSFLFYLFLLPDVNTSTLEMKPYEGETSFWLKIYRFGVGDDTPASMHRMQPNGKTAKVQQHNINI